MSDEKNDKAQQMSIMKVVGIAIGLPSTILGVFFFVYYLINEGIIPGWLGMLIIVAIIVYIFYLMVRNVYQKK